MAPAATRTTSFRWRRNCRPVRRCCRRAARSRRTACRASSAGWRKACSTWPTLKFAPPNWRISSPPRKAYGIDAPVAVGFSNGANIAAALLLTRPQVLRGAVLLRAMLPFEPEPLPDLAGKPALLLSGSNDTMISAAGRERLAAVLQAAGADLVYKVLPTGHNLTQNDLNLAAQWLKEFGLEYLT